jgi:hypothetical protein
LVPKWEKQMVSRKGTNLERLRVVAWESMGLED